MPKRKSQLEKTIQSSIQSFLEVQEELGNLVYQKNNTGAVRIERTGARSSFMRFGKVGSPDFLVWRERVGCSLGCKYHQDVEYLETVFIEVKTDVGRQSEAQKDFQARIQNMGGHYHVVRSLDEVKKIIL